MCIAMASNSKNDRTFVVAYFHPAGNNPKKFPMNVLKSGCGSLKGLNWISISLGATAWIIAHTF
jgi:hypothetical protein